MSSSGFAYAALCVVVPAVWGVVMYWVFGAIERRRRKVQRGDPPPVDYSI